LFTIFCHDFLRFSGSGGEWRIKNLFPMRLILSLLLLVTATYSAPNIVVVLVDDWGWSNNGIHKGDGEKQYLDIGSVGLSVGGSWGLLQELRGVWADGGLQ
jgi:hypothetical protein